ncbi:1-acyl-sn-glycerol-3-phosphate acyltransferase [Salinibacterium sp. SWN248]|uniref:lysophospholipid acyltransferase family protein n=1 Tax=Salinibacterium sp. SWN248 TaxID=2792056 RepID=UPI0018CF6B77|nr:lysophospholipid acyltransferase family protein [Salinibacterium sp. SWN248]MBH0024878.1 1-acyl-sn-glycerol-3-phosphate acyltransferase [Salinibacterium sp. SWN248]
MKYRNEPIYTAAIGAGRAMFGALRVRRTVIGSQNLPAEGGAVFAMTHFGYLEFALVEWALWLHNHRRIRFMAKKSVFEKRVVGSFMRNMKHIPVDMKAGANAYASAVTALRTGELIGVFPEAGVSASFTIRDFKTGAVRLAAEAGVPVIPIALWGGQRLMTKNRTITLRERVGIPIVMVVGDPMMVAPTDDATTATARLKRTMEGLLETAQKAYPLDGTGQWWQPRHLGGTAPTPDEAAAADAERDLRRAEAARKHK